MPLGWGYCVSNLAVSELRGLSVPRASLPAPSAHGTDHPLWTLLSRGLAVRASAFKNMTKILACTHRSPLLVFPIHCGIGCHGNGCPHTQFIVWGSHRVFFSLSFFNSNSQRAIKPTINISVQPFLAVLNSTALASNFGSN